MREFMAVSKALSDETRVRLLLALWSRALCVCQLIELVRLAPSTVSKHMAILKQARLVESRKEGRWIYYRLPSPGESPPVVREGLAWVARSVARHPKIREDAKRMRKILKISPEELCNRQLLDRK